MTGSLLGRGRWTMTMTVCRTNGKEESNSRTLNNLTFDQVEKVIDDDIDIFLAWRGIRTVSITAQAVEESTSAPGFASQQIIKSKTKGRKRPTVAK